MNAIDSQHYVYYTQQLLGILRLLKGKNDIILLDLSIGGILIPFRNKWYLVPSKSSLIFRFYYVDADMRACNYDKRTALHLAACEGHSDCVKFLVEKCKISPLVKDR